MYLCHKTTIMTEKEIKDKVGALHQRLLDDEENYVKLINLLEEYQELSDQYGLMVSAALKDGLKNYEHYLKLESALSPRSIIIEKKGDPATKRVKKSDAEGYYRIAFIMDDGSRQVVHFGRKQTHALYILFLLCSQKNGLLADFFQKEGAELTPVLQTVTSLIQKIYPHMDKESAETMAKDLGPDRSFSDTLQKMKAPVMDCLKQAKAYHDEFWYMPYSVNLKKKQLYRMHMPQVNIVYPPEFQSFIDALPDALDILRQEGIDTNGLSKNLEYDFAQWKKAAEEGDADGLYYMGVYYGTGDVVSHDYQKSVDYLEKAAEKGHLDAVFQLGVYHMFGFGVKKDIHRALNFFEQAAKEDHAEAAAWAGQIYEYGTDGIKVNHKKAFDLYMIAARHDNEEAMWYVIQGYLLGQGTKRDYPKAYEWVEKAEKLGYYKITFLYGVFLFNQGEEYYEDALDYFIDAANEGMPMAYCMMAKMAIKGYCRTDDDIEEAKEWLLKGAEVGDETCINTLKRAYPDVYEAYKEEWEHPVSLRELLIQLVMGMDHNEQESFLLMTDAYRERWHEGYLREICKQLSIHKPSDDDSGDGGPKRKITIRKSRHGDVAYELVLTLANGEEVVVNRIYPISFVLFLLTIICSYKNGYTTAMAKDETCRPILKELVRLVYDNQIANLDRYVEENMSHEQDEAEKKNEDYYKQYSNKAKISIKEAVGLRDDVNCFLFGIYRMKGRKIIRRTNLDPKDILLPPELMDLANRMPDALDVLQLTEYQQDKNILKE